MKYIYVLAAALLFGTSAFAQQLERVEKKIEKVEPAGKVGNAFLAVPAAVSREIGGTAKDLATFRDPQWTILTIAQIGASIADGTTSLNNLNACGSCLEVGPSRFVIGTRPDTHKYIIAGVFEIGIETVVAHYMRNHGPRNKWYWRAIWTAPQSVSLYEHARAANRNAGIDIR